MRQSENILFGDALDLALVVVREFGTSLADEFTLVRDLRGRIRVVLKSKPENVDNLKMFEAKISTSLGVYGFGSGRSVVFADELSERDTIFDDRRLLPSLNGLNIYLLDRQIIGQDWMRNALNRTTTNPRVTFYGIKGGVGRSTALVNWAWHLAEQGKKVLVFDLDLESPGASSSLLPTSHLPDFGIVDWFVEDGVGQADVIEGEILGKSPLDQGLAGEIYVISAYGSKTGEYLPKLSRCYAEFSGNAPISWAERLQRLVERMESLVNPDVVILDSRAGLHDIAAVLATRMDADTLLFAINTPQTWDGYSLLFKHWHNHPRVRAFRSRLQIIASMVPETNRDDYLKSFREHAWDLFRDHLYDSAGPDDSDAFSFDLDDETAPHAPVPIFWHRALQEFNPNVGGIDTKTAAEALGIFFEQADRLLASAGQD
ncbi:ParA family protein [Sulfuriferula thiophila]|uniref:ParA family protein n=1 Tax=Sulfuriferula thiophila TaxID=1781211 RepID=UPI0016797DF4|nr:AAA family ATPase [Sulfuriferula thiophila]